MTEKQRAHCISAIIPELKKSGVSLPQIQEELDYRERSQVSDGREGWDDALIDYSTEELTNAEILWDVDKED